MSDRDEHNRRSLEKRLHALKSVEDVRAESGRRRVEGRSRLNDHFARFQPVP
jgi:hypothetical protein